MNKIKFSRIKLAILLLVWIEVGIIGLGIKGIISNEITIALLGLVVLPIAGLLLYLMCDKHHRLKIDTTKDEVRFIVGDESKEFKTFNIAPKYPTGDYIVGVDPYKSDGKGSYEFYVLDEAKNKVGNSVIKVEQGVKNNKV